MRVNFFDLGMYNGVVTNMFINNFERIGLDYRVYGFEPLTKHYNHLNRIFKDNEKVFIRNRAISNINSKKRLFYCMNELGYSLFNDHESVNSGYEMVKTIKFSDWFKKKFKYKRHTNDYLIIKADIEGAEYYLFDDLMNNNLMKYFDIFIGDGYMDIKKVKRFKSKAKSYIENIKNHINEVGAVYYRVNSRMNKNMIKVRRRLRAYKNIIQISKENK